MAEDQAIVTDQQEVQREEEKLKYLDFVEDAVQQAMAYASKAYDFAKEKAGPLKPGVVTIETTIITIAGPTYDKFHDVPVGVLKFVDRKVDGVLPEAVKDVTIQAKSLTTDVVTNVKNEGVVVTAKELLVKIEPVAEGYASSAWKAFNQVPLVTTVVKAIAPTASLVNSYVPLVPAEKLAKVFTLPESNPEGEAAPEPPAEEAPEPPAEEAVPVVEE